MNEVAAALNKITVDAIIEAIGGTRRQEQFRRVVTDLVELHRQAVTADVLVRLGLTEKKVA